jgi:hypothetical protein
MRPAVNASAELRRLAESIDVEQRIVEAEKDPGASVTRFPGGVYIIREEHRHEALIVHVGSYSI